MAGVAVTAVMVAAGQEVETTVVVVAAAASGAGVEKGLVAEGVAAPWVVGAGADEGA